LTSWFFVEVNARYQRDQLAREVRAQQHLAEAGSDHARKPWLSGDWLIRSRWSLRRAAKWVYRGFLRRPTRHEPTGDFTPTREASGGHITLRAHGTSK
jgi:hypothetical protein